MYLRLTVYVTSETDVKCEVSHSLPVDKRRKNVIMESIDLMHIDRKSPCPIICMLKFLYQNVVPVLVYYCTSVIYVYDYHSW